MSNHERRNEWSLIAAIALIALGVWFLLGNVFGPGWAEALKRISGILWAIGFIVLGVALYLSATGASKGTGGKRLYRSRGDRMVAGVIGGAARYLGIDPMILRVIYVLFGLVTGVGPALLFYIIAMIVIPEEPVGGVQPVWPQTRPPAPSPTSTGTWSSSGWPHTGTETVQTPPPAPEKPEEEAPPSAEGPSQS